MSQNDVIQLYPQTSCPCGSCNMEKEKLYPKIKTNRALRSCNEPSFLQCANTFEFKSGILPQDKTGYEQINPEVYMDKLDPNYNLIPCDIGDCPKEKYTTNDPRLIDVLRYQQQTLDRPPITSDIKLRTIYNKEYSDYGKGFTPYNLIKDGQIQYYIDKSIQDPFYKPNFVDKMEEESLVYKDPMGSIKPEYNRKPLVNTCNPTTKCVNGWDTRLSFIQDSQSHREDLMSLQMRKRNQERWEPRWRD